jgi:transcriptional regulator with XRE-family HTH domain
MTRQNRAAALPTQGMNAEEPDLGACLRAVRDRHRWPLATVAEKTGLAISTLSRIENGQISLSYAKLQQLCRGLGLDLPQLFAAANASPPENVTGRRTHTPPGQGRQVRAGHYFYEYLCTDLASKKMTPILGSSSARTLEEAGGLVRHEGEELTYVLDGTLDLYTEYYEPQRVEVGGCIYVDSRMGHAYVAVGNKPVKFLSVCTSPEPELHEAMNDRRASTAPKNAAKKSKLARTSR